MRISTRHTLSSILKTAFAALLIFVAFIAVVELFSKMDAIMNNHVPVSALIKNILLGLPKYMMMAISVSFLFAVTFFLSQLQANNELIALYNAGLSRRRIVFPILVMTLLLSIILTAFNETVGIKINAMHESSEETLFGSGSSSLSNISVRDPESGLICYAGSFSEKKSTLYNVNVLIPTDCGIEERVNASRAVFDGEGWRFENGRDYRINEDGTVDSAFFDLLIVDAFRFSPKVFNNLSGKIESMEFNVALEYLQKTREVNSEAYYEYATSFMQRLFSALPLFILVLISVLINYNFKKNILLFSILQSLCTAVVYYVAVMVTTIMGNQGIIAPYMTVLFPALAIFVPALIIKAAAKLQ
jgi:Predicted permeases